MHPESIIEIVSCGANFIRMSASYGAWDHPTMQLIAFRVIKEHKGAREIWYYRGEVYGFKNRAPKEATHFREVME